MKVAAISSMPPTVNGRAPKRSDSEPAMGPATRKPTVIGQQIDARPQRGGLEAVAVQRKPDALQPDDEHELQTAAAHRRHQPGEVAHAERRGPEQPDVDHRRVDVQFDEAERHQRQQPERRSRRAPTGWSSRWWRRRRAGCRR